MSLIEKSQTVDHRIPAPARRLESFVMQMLKAKRTEALDAIHSGSVVVNGRIAKHPHVQLEVGDQVKVTYEKPTAAPSTPLVNRREQVEIVYLDQAIAIINKPAALLTVPTPKRESRTVISELRQLLRRENPRDDAFCVHRLDRGVSGLLIFARSLEWAEKLRDQFADRKPKRRYIAIVHGDVVEKEGTFRSYLATDENLNRYSTDDPEQGELAITHYRILQRLEGMTLVEVWLETGRRNQIRVHFAEAGHSIIGDERYGRHLLPFPTWPFRRLALHAQTLGIQHPVSGKELEFTSKLPREFRSLLQSK